MSDEMEWGDPPADSRAVKTARWSMTAQALRENPGRWAIVHRTRQAGSATEFATRLRRGTVKSFGPGFQAATEGTVVYARFVGEGCE